MFRYFVGVFSFFSVIGESLMKLTSRAFAPCLNQVRLIFGLPSLVCVILCGMSSCSDRSILCDERIDPCLSLPCSVMELTTKARAVLFSIQFSNATKND